MLAVIGLHHGGHLPATGIQDRLVTPLSVPNVLAALAGQGGETGGDRTPAHAALGLAAVAAALAVTWRRSWLPGAVGLVIAVPAARGACFVASLPALLDGPVVDGLVGVHELAVANGHLS